MRIPSILRRDQSRTAYIAIAAAGGVAAAAVVGDDGGMAVRPGSRMDRDRGRLPDLDLGKYLENERAAIEVVVQQRHPARRPADTIVLLPSIASLAGVGYLLVASNVKGPDSAIAAAVGVLSVIASWLAVHVVYTLRYAVQYYTEPIRRDRLQSRRQAHLRRFRLSRVHHRRDLWRD